MNDLLLMMPVGEQFFTCLLTVHLIVLFNLRVSHLVQPFPKSAQV